MNTGLQDAANLGWKLAAAAKGEASEALLDSYQAERHAVGRLVLRLSGSVLRAALVRSRPARLGRDLVLRSVIGIGPLQRRAAGLLSGIDIAYERPRRAHELVGRRMPDVPVEGERSRLYEALRDGSFILLEDAPQVVLVRPDGYVGFAGEPQGLEAALEAFGRPAYARLRSRSSSPAMAVESRSASPGRTM
jgi:hypothetical protein